MSRPHPSRNEGTGQTQSAPASHQTQGRPRLSLTPGAAAGGGRGKLTAHDPGPAEQPCPALWPQLGPSRLLPPLRAPPSGSSPTRPPAVCTGSRGREDPWLHRALLSTGPGRVWGGPSGCTSSAGAGWGQQRPGTITPTCPERPAGTLSRSGSLGGWLQRAQVGHGVWAGQVQRVRPGQEGQGGRVGPPGLTCPLGTPGAQASPPGERLWGEARLSWDTNHTALQTQNTKEGGGWGLQGGPGSGPVPRHTRGT